MAWPATKFQLRSGVSSETPSPLRRGVRVNPKHVSATIRSVSAATSICGQYYHHHLRHELHRIPTGRTFVQKFQCLQKGEGDFFFFFCLEGRTEETSHLRTDVTEVGIDQASYYKISCPIFRHDGSHPAAATENHLPLPCVDPLSKDLVSGFV